VEPILVVPELEVGEVLLFLKYLFSANIARFCSSEDLPILKKVARPSGCLLLS
jgi:hypothetical protein